MNAILFEGKWPPIEGPPYFGVASGRLLMLKKAHFDRLGSYEAGRQRPISFGPNACLLQIRQENYPMMGKMVLKFLKKLKHIVFDKYILLISVPLGFLLEFLITSPFLILCSLDGLLRKKNRRWYLRTPGYDFYLFDICLAIVARIICILISQVLRLLFVDGNYSEFIF